MKEHRSLRKQGILFFSLATLPIILPISARAISEAETSNFLYKYSDYFKKNTIVWDALRILQWELIKLLKWILDSCVSLYKNTLGLFNFCEYGELKKWIGTLDGVFKVILALSIMWLGVLLIVNHKKKPHILTSILLAGLTISALSEIMITANKAVSSYCKELAGDSVSDTIINENFYDLFYIDNTYGLATFSDDAKSLKKYHYKSKPDIDSISINSIINYENSELTDDAQYILGHYYDYFPDKKAESGKNIASEEHGIYNGFGWNSGNDSDLFNEFYYRYKFNTFIIVISLLAFIIVYLIVSYKTVRLIWELPLKRVLALLYSADVTGTQKTLKILGSIKDSYCIILFTAIELKMFLIMQTYLSHKFNSDEFSYCIILLFVAFAIIDGPNIIQSLTGEDAGLQSGLSRVVAIYRGGNGVARKTAGLTIGAGKGIGKGVGKMVKNGLAEKNGQSEGKTLSGKTNLSQSNSSNGGAGANKDMKDSLNNKEKDSKKENGNARDMNLRNHSPSGSKENENMKAAMNQSDEDLNSKQQDVGQSDQKDMDQKDMNLKEQGNDDKTNNNLSNQEKMSKEPLKNDNNGKGKQKTFDPSTGKNHGSSNSDMRKAMSSKNKGSVKNNGSLPQMNGNSNKTDSALNKAKSSIQSKSNLSNGNSRTKNDDVASSNNLNTSLDKKQNRNSKKEDMSQNINKSSNLKTGLNNQKQSLNSNKEDVSTKSAKNKSVSDIKSNINKKDNLK